MPDTKKEKRRQVRIDIPSSSASDNDVINDILRENIPDIEEDVPQPAAEITSERFPLFLMGVQKNRFIGLNRDSDTDVSEFPALRKVIDFGASFSAEDDDPADVQPDSEDDALPSLLEGAQQADGSKEAPPPEPVDPNELMDFVEQLKTEYEQELENAVNPKAPDTSNIIYDPYNTAINSDFEYSTDDISTISIEDKYKLKQF